MRGKVVILILLVLCLTIPICILLDKPNIEEATYEQLEEINGIGNILATRVLSYLDTSEEISINDLENVKGIGPKKLKLIKEVFE